MFYYLWVSWSDNFNSNDILIITGKLNMYHQDELDHLPIIGRNFQRESFQQHHHLLTAVRALTF